MKEYFKNIWSSFSSLLVNRKKAVVVSLVNATILTFGTYFMNNSSLLTGEDLDLYAGLEYLFGSNEIVNDSVLLINTAYDKQIAMKSIDGICVGNTDVTDREALVKLLQSLKAMPKDSCYRFIFLDVRFEAGDETEHDSILFEEISSTPRLVVANHEDIVLASDKIKDKAALSDYDITLTSNNFFRYKFLRAKGASMPLRVYHDLYGDSIRKCGWFYYSNKGLCQNTHVVKSVLKLDNEDSESNNGSSVMATPYYQNLNKINDIQSLSELAKNKYVVVGNMIDDKHDTFFGKIPGSVLVFSAYWSLKNGENLVSSWIEVIFFLLFFCISLSMFSRSPIIERIPWVKQSKSKWFRFFITFLGYSTVLFIATVILYLCFEVISSILIPALYFSIQKAYFTYKYIKV